jgi:LuxR family maltose regulon positive regulatory protein
MLVLVDAPVGYGKSTILSQWREVEGRRRRFAWLSLQAADSDPSRLLARVLGALQGAIPGFGATVAQAIEVPGSGVAEGGVLRLLEELAEVRERLVIVLDDYHLLRGRGVHGLMERLIVGLPPTAQVAIGTRSDPPLPLGRLRASGALFELRAADLRFDVAEARELAGSSGVVLTPDDLETLVDRTEGWPAGLYLALLILQSEPDPSAFVQRFAGTHRHVADYLSEQVLRREPPATSRFLVRTSVLDRMCGPLCDAVLESQGSRMMLERLERSNLFVVALDHDRVWYRYHHLFGQMLRDELSRTEPDLAPVLHGRASRWFEAEDLHEEAVGHALAAGDGPRAAELIARHWLELFNAGRLETVRRWLDDLGEGAIAGHPPAALTAGWVAGLEGRPAEMERWLAIAEAGTDDGPLPDGTASLRSGASLVRGLLGHIGLEARRACLTRAAELEPAGSTWRPFALWGLGQVALLFDDPATAKRLLDEALSHGAVRGEAPRQPILAMIALSELSIAETALGHVDVATRLVRRAERIRQERGLQADPRSSVVALATGVIRVAQNELGEGREAMERALELRRGEGLLSPWPTLDVLATLAPVRFLLGDVDGAAELLAEARMLLSGFEDDAGEFSRRLEEVEHLLIRAARRATHGQSLTDREMSILALMPTRLSQREIGGELFLSLNTVKTHSRAIYRKLEVSSRREAVDRARELGLL